jgi:hypothetical protein
MERKIMNIVGTNESEAGKAYDSESLSIRATLTAWKRALFTREDPFHCHKVLGILVLLSYLWRFTLFFDDMAFRSHPKWTVPTIALHWMLTASSFQFKIPQRRIRDGGRIWPQYRWHALIFTTRYLMFIALYWYEQQNGIGPNYDMNFVIVIAVMAAADYVTFAVGEDFRSNTIRDLDGPGAIKFAFSIMQFNATAFLIVGIRSYAMPFYAMFPVQVTPFVGTLRRKGLFTSKFWGAFVYGALLVGGFVVQAYQYDIDGGERMHLFGRSVGLLAALLRLTPFLPSFCWPLQNKFVIWTLMFLIVRQCRPVVSHLDLVKMRSIILALLVALAISCYVKVKSGYYPSDVKAAKMKAKSL